MLHLKFGDDLEGSGRVVDVIKIKEVKTDKTKTFYLNDSVKKCVTEYIKDHACHGDAYLFASRKGRNKPITRIQAYRVINEAAYIAKIKGSIGTHTLRKTFGYWAYKQGIDITLLMKIFNHSSPAITLRYIGITQEEIKNVYFSLNL